MVVVFGLQSCVDKDASEGDTSEVDEDVALPPPPGLAVANVSGGFTPSQQLTWTPVAGAKDYLILRGTGGPGSETSYTTCCTGGPPFLANHLTASTNYCWEVEAVNSIGQKSAPSNEVCLATLATAIVDPPATVTATAVSSSRINVGWTAVTGATRYIVNQSVAGGPYSVLTSLNALSYPNVGLTPGTSYCYTVQTVANAGTSAPSAPACTSTFVLGLEGYYKLSEASGTTANDSSGFGRNATLSGGAMFSSASPMAPIDPDTGNIEPHLDSGTAGVATTAAAIAPFRLATDFSLAFWVMQPAAASSLPIMGMRNSGSCGSGTGWEVSQSSSGLAFVGQNGGARLFGQALTVGTWTHVGVTYTAGTLKLYINGAQVQSMAYTAANSLAGAVQFGHFAGCAGGAVRLDEVQIFSRALTAPEMATFGTRPPAPTALTLTKNTSSSQGLSWTAPASGADRWVILRGTASGNEVHYTHATNPPTTFNASHLTPNTQYSWEVETVQDHLISVPSNEIVATTPAGPAAPTGVTATTASTTRINVSWTAVTNATQYFVYEAMSMAGPYTQVGHTNSPTVTFGVTGLTTQTTYWFEVQAEDAGLTRSPMSTPVSATTN